MSFVFVEYLSYRELVADLSELQSSYKTCRVLDRLARISTPSKNKEFVQVDRSNDNLGIVCKPLTLPARKRKKSQQSKVMRKAIFSWPLAQNDFWISSFFGPRKFGKRVKFHSGIDLAALTGTSVKAAAGGKVIEAKYNSGYGNTIVIQHNRKYKTRYAHLHKINVKLGQVVARGQKIALVGATGLVRGSSDDASHLHFEVYAFGRQVNPMLFLAN